MANDLPQPQSYEQIESDLLSAYAAKIGVNDYNVGSAITSLFEVVALATARSSGDIFQILRDFSVDRATGVALKRLALENNVTPITATATTGTVNVIDSSFTKISTTVYSGTNPPNIGSTSINVNNASSFPPTGSVYIGRGTNNIEGPIAYTAITPVGGYFSITLATGTTKFHNLAESVILSQGGNRNVPINSIVVAPSTGTYPDIQFQITASAVILDGETEVDNVPVTALIPGSAGNVARGAITEFANPPFTGAIVANPVTFGSGKDSETDDQLRIRIKAALASTGLGTATAVQSAVIGATSTDEPAIVISDQIVQGTNSATLYIDDGTGYEEKTAGVGIESIVDAALGGESFFQLATGGRQAPVAKAQLVSTISSPFDLIGGDTLAVVVGEQTYQHVFANSDFLSPGSATAFEVTASINADTTLGFEALTSNSGQNVVIRAIAETNDSLQVTTPSTSGRDASILLGLPTSQAQTLRLYKNDIPLSKDGLTASIFTQNQQLWSPSIADGDTLILSVDGTNSITYTINNTDFIKTGLYNSVASSNSLTSWVAVFNNKLTGVTAEQIGSQIELFSNLGTSVRANLTISPSSTLVAKGMFSATLGLSSAGASSDFTLLRNTAQFELTIPLVMGDKLAAGDINTEAYVLSSKITTGSLTLPADGHLWVIADGSASLINTGVTSSTTLTVSTPSTNVVRFQSSISGAFSLVNLGDYVIIWSAELNVNNRIEGRVNAFTSTTLDILITPSEWAAIVPQTVTFFNGFSIVRTQNAPQKLKLPIGTYTLDEIAQEFQTQSNSLAFSVIQEEFLKIQTTTKNIEGAIFVVTADTNGILLGFTNGSSNTNQPSLLAFYESQAYDGELPVFIHTTVATGSAANPIDSYISSFVSSIDFSNRDPNEIICLLNPYGSSNDAQPFGECVQESSLSGTTVDIVQEARIRRIRALDRFFIANPLDFGPADTSVVIVDNNPESNSFTIPFYRRALTNTGYPNNSLSFNAYDVDSGPTTNFASYFGIDFDFSNFKVLMQAKKVLKPTPSQTAILYRSTLWGRSGEKVDVGYVYPNAANLPISSNVNSTTTVDITISLASGSSVSSNIDSTTEWNVTIVANSPVSGVDQVTYTWNGSGTAPNLSLAGTEYVNISINSGFSAANTGIFKLSPNVPPTSTSFTVQRPHGIAIAESNKFTQFNNAIVFYLPSSTTASQIANYVNANLSAYISATLVNDGGSSGSGIITLSTYEDSNFTYASVFLLDGINWIASNTFSGSPQFTFKKPLSLPSDVGYAFNNGETIELSPATMDQVRRLQNVLAVTGFTTTGSIYSTDRGNKLEIATDTQGSSGSIQVIGGLANSYSVPLLNSAIRLDNTNVQISVDSSAGAGIQSDQWFKLQAGVAQTKNSLFGSNTSIQVVGNNPITGQSIINLFGRNLNQRYFGKPRNHIRSKNDTFRIEKQGSLVCLSWNGVGSSPQFIKNPLNFNDSAGGTVSITTVAASSNVTYTITAGNTNFTELSIGDLITISGLATSANNGTFLVTGVSDDGTVITVLNPNGASEAGVVFVAGQFTASSQVSEGDTIFITAPFSILNRGYFRVIRMYNNSVWYENPDAIEEEQLLPTNLQSINVDSTTSLMVNASNHTAYVNWNGVGTEPTLGNANVGDIVTFGIDFNSANRGDFMVLDAGAKLQEITALSMPPASQFSNSGPGNYFLINSAGNVNQYYVWFNVSGGNSDPSVGGKTGVQIAIVGGGSPDSSSTVASKTAAVLNVTTGLTATAAGNIVTVTTTDSITTNPATNFNIPAPFNISILQTGRRTFLECINPSAVNQAAVFVSSGVFQDHRPQIQFWEYEASVPGDLFVTNGNTLTTVNAGSYGIVQVLNRDTAIISGTLASVFDSSLNGVETTVFIQEGVPYTGYKHVYLVSARPQSTTENFVVFDTNAVYEKLNQSGNVSLTSLNKMNFSTVFKNGLDSYLYNTGLVAEANRIIYGDPRDPITYPGVGAAGANIYVRGPLVRRIQISIDIRLKTGVPFAQTVDQVRASVTSFVNSNNVGQSLAISDIISVVAAIPGISAVSISSPSYSPTSDLIFIAQSEKAYIINPLTDIAVSQVS